MVYKNSDPFCWQVYNTIPYEEIACIEAQEFSNGIRINIFAVKTSYRKKGIGANLFKKLLKEINNQYSKITVIPQPFQYYEKDIILDKETVIQIYKKLGFKENPNKKDVFEYILY